MYQQYLDRINFTLGDMQNVLGTGLAGENGIWQNPAWGYAVLGLLALAAGLLALLYVVQNRTVRIYNWNGKRYRYLGRAGLRRGGGGYVVRIGERMADLSYTTLYQLCPAKRFVRRNRYKELLLCAGNAQCLLHVDGCMRQSVYYRQGC